MDADLLGNLFVQLDQLHASLRLEDVLRALDETLANLVGAEEWTIFLRDHDSGQLEVLSTAPDAEIDSDGAPASWHEVMERACATREAVYGGDPLVMLPLASGLGRPSIGVIAIARLVPHRPTFGARERSMLASLKRHAGVAIEAALCAEAAGAPRCDVKRLRQRLSGA